MALTITKAYAAGAALTEAHIDNFRNGLHTQFNTTKFDSTQFSASMALDASKFTGSIIPTDTVIDFGLGGKASLGLDGSKNLVFNTTNAATEMQFITGASGAWVLEFWTDKLYVPGDIIVAKGNANRTVLQALSSYKKPVLEWASSTDVKVQNNSSSSNETILFFPTFVVAVEESLAGGSPKFRQASLTTTANGYGTLDTGAARGGRRSGVSLTTNSWYAVYACKVRSGSDYNATTAKFILVYDTTLPYPTNESALDGYYGSGCWLYLGLVRYGFGAFGNSSAIPKFKYSNKGWCYFYDCDVGAALGGLALAYSTTDADDSATEFLALSSGMSGQVIPDLVGHIDLNIFRNYVSDWYIKDSSGDIIWRGGWQTDDGTIPHGFRVTLPFVTAATAYKIYQTRKSNGAQVKAVVLVGFSDGYLLLRRQGHGI